MLLPDGVVPARPALAGSPKRGQPSGIRELSDRMYLRLAPCNLTQDGAAHGSEKTCYGTRDAREDSSHPEVENVSEASAGCSPSEVPDYSLRALYLACRLLSWPL